MFNCELQRHGTQIWRGDCNMQRTAMCGIYAILNGKKECFLPDSDSLRAALPYHYKKAFDRASLWWTQEYSDVIRMDLWDYKGNPMGSIFAKWKEGQE